MSIRINEIKGLEERCKLARKAFCKRTGMTTQKIAEELGYNRSNLHRIEMNGYGRGIVGEEKYRDLERLYGIKLLPEFSVEGLPLVPDDFAEAFDNAVILQRVKDYCRDKDNETSREILEIIEGKKK